MLISAKTKRGRPGVGSAYLGVMISLYYFLRILSLAIDAKRCKLKTLMSR
jgi:hypothetical protein